MGETKKKAVFIFDYRQSLETDALFRHEPEELFQAGAESFVAGTIETHGGNLECNSGDNGMDISDVPIRDYLLAKAFPSRTRPMGSTKNSEWDAQAGNFNMYNLYMTSPGDWLHLDDNDNNEWRHSDLKDIPYVHVYQLFAKITTREN